MGVVSTPRSSMTPPLPHWPGALMVCRSSHSLSLSLSLSFSLLHTHTHIHTFTYSHTLAHTITHMHTQKYMYMHIAATYMYIVHVMWKHKMYMYMYYAVYRCLEAISDGDRLRRPAINKHFLFSFQVNFSPWELSTHCDYAMEQE